MSESSLLIHEQYGSNGEIFYYRRQGPNQITRQRSRGILTNYFYNIITFFKQIFLPHGYPTSVSDDYFDYQLWDTIQAFCSTLTGAFTTRAILKGMGFGNAQATALSATVTWILKDGAGMVGRIFFAWWKGCYLDYDCKKWRFFADIINDLAMAIELCLPYFKNFSMPILCVSSILKSMVGVAGGATRASITQHQAINENMAEISAIDGNQETVVNLIASLLSIMILSYVNDAQVEMAIVIALILMHLFSNYKAVESLIFKKFNRQRLAILLKNYYHVGVLLSPKSVNSVESVVLGWGMNDTNLCGFKIKMGESIKKVGESYGAEDFSKLLNNYADKPYLIIPDVKKGYIHVSFEKTENSRTVIEAYFYATTLALALCMYFDQGLEINPKRHLHQSTTVSRLSSFMKNYQRLNHVHKIPVTFYSHFSDFVNAEINMFFTILELKEWDLSSHDINVGDWRANWKTYLKKLN